MGNDCRDLFWSVRREWLSNGVLDERTIKHLKRMVREADYVCVLGRSYSEFLKNFFDEKGFLNRDGHLVSVNYGVRYPNFKVFVRQYNCNKGIIVSDRDLRKVPCKCFVVDYDEKSMKFKVSLKTRLRFLLAKLGGFKCQNRKDKVD